MSRGTLTILLIATFTGLAVAERASQPASTPSKGDVLRADFRHMSDQELWDIAVSQARFETGEQQGAG